MRGSTRPQPALPNTRPIKPVPRLTVAPRRNNPKKTPAHQYTKQRGALYLAYGRRLGFIGLEMGENGERLHRRGELTICVKALKNNLALEKSSSRTVTFEKTRAAPHDIVAGLERRWERAVAIM